MAQGKCFGIQIQEIPPRITEREWQYLPGIWTNWLSHYCLISFLYWLRKPLGSKIFLNLYEVVLKVYLNVFLLCRDTHGIATKNDRLVSCVMILLAVSASTVAISSDIYSIFNRWQWWKWPYREGKLIQFISGFEIQTRIESIYLIKKGSPEMQ